jgi:DNA replication protein DnaC
MNIAIKPGKKYIVTHKYECKLCKDAGFLGYDVPLGHPNWGKPYPCPGDTHSESRISKLESITGMHRADFRHKMSDVLRCKGNADTLEACAKFLKDPWRVGFLYIWGKWGNGKTTLLFGIVNEFMSGSTKGKHKSLNSARYVSFNELVVEIKATYPRGTELEYIDVYNKAARAEVLVIDELDKVSDQNGEITPHDFKLMTSLLHARYDAYRQKAGVTVVCSNKNPFEFVGPSVCSRLGQNGFIVVENKADDARPNAKRCE